MKTTKSEYQNIRRRSARIAGGTASELNFSKATVGPLKKYQWRKGPVNVTERFSKSINLTTADSLRALIIGEPTKPYLDGCRTNKKPSSPRFIQLIQSTNI